MDEDQGQEQGGPVPDHVAGAGKGEETVLKEGREAGREDAGSTGADRPAGTRTAADATSTAANTDPIDPESPPMPPP